MILAEHIQQNGPLHFQANNMPALKARVPFMCQGTGIKYFVKCKGTE